MVYAVSAGGPLHPGYSLSGAMRHSNTAAVPFSARNVVLKARETRNHIVDNVIFIR